MRGRSGTGKWGEAEVGEEGSEGRGCFVLVALPAFLPSVIYRSFS